MSDQPSLLIGGASGKQVRMIASMANRHGMIAGATGTGKTVTLQIMAEEFSRLGVPVFVTDVKGDLSGLCQPGKPHPKIDERIEKIAIEGYQARPTPTVLWDLFGELGHPIRTTISDMGPLLLSSLLELNDTQTGVMYACFKIADDNGMLLLDLKDLRSMLTWVADNAKELKSEYGNISSSSIGAIQRDLLVLEQQGAEHFFNEPAIKLQDLMQVDFSGNGVISIMDVTKLIHKSPRVYATFLIWLLAELFENLPEVGDADRPKLVLFFDEAHLLFNDAPDALVEKIEQVVRLIRSKGVGVYFISQSPLDIPESILGQLGMKIQHALRAFTPKDQKAVKVAAQTFRQNPNINTEKVITELGLGEALVSVLDAGGKPTQVEQTLIRPPESRIGPMTPEERSAHMQRSPYSGRYDEVVDRESAHEMLKEKAEQLAKQQDELAAKEQAEKAELAKEKASTKKRGRQTPVEAMVKSAARSMGSQIGRQIMRGILGSLFGGKR